MTNSTVADGPRRFTRGDLYTFLLGLAAAVAVPLGEALVTLNLDPASDLEVWARGLLTGILAAAGNYLLTQIRQGRSVQREAWQPAPLAGVGMDVDQAVDVQPGALDEADLMRALEPKESLSVVKPY